jgi:hypothetical protein
MSIKASYLFGGQAGTIERNSAAPLVEISRCAPARKLNITDMDISFFIGLVYSGDII